MPYTFAIAIATTQAKIAKEYVFADAISSTEKKNKTTSKYKYDTSDSTKV